MEMAQREKITWSKLGQDLYGMFCGKDYKLSIRRVLGTVAFLGIIRAAEATYSGASVPEHVFISLGGLTIGFFALTSWSNNQENKLKEPQDGG